MRWTLSLLLFVLTFASPALHADGPKLKQIHLGDDILGKHPADDDMKGKVVLYEYWGVNCPPCIATMPHVVRWNEEYSELGLLTVGVHSQNVDADEIRSVAQRLGMRFPVVQGSNGGGVTTIPHSQLFDHTGKCVYDGKPAGVEPVLRTTIAAAILSDVSDPPKAIATIADAMKKGGSPVDFLKKLNTLKEDKDKKVSDPAKAMIGKITGVAQARLDKAKENVKTDPVAAYDAATYTAARWKGFPLGTQATEIVNKVKTDKVVVAELKARPTLDTLTKLDTVLSAAMKEDSEAKAADFKKAHAAQLRQMTQAYQTITKSYPDTPSAKAAEVIGKKYELKAK